MSRSYLECHRGNSFKTVDISSGLTDLPRSTVAVCFRVTTAGTLTFLGWGVGDAAFEREFDTGTYRLEGNFKQMGPGTTATIAVLDPADEISVEYVGAES